MCAVITQSARVECPRCGYDLRGRVPADAAAIARGEDGTCAECGLAFVWQDVLDPTKRTPAWNVENAESRMFRAAPSTFLRSFLPWVFWSQLRMEHRIRPRRIAVYVLLCVLPVLYIGFAIGQGALNAANVRLAGSFGVVTAEELDAFVQGLGLPLSPRSPGTLTFTGARGAPMNLESPWELAASWFHSPATRWPAACALACLAVAPLVFALLPIARRRAKVRWAHIGRITAYSGVLVLPGYVVVMAVSPMMTLAGGMPLVIFGMAAGWRIIFWIALLGSWAVWALFWHFAVSRYLRMERPRAVAISIVLITTLAGLLAIYLTDHDNVVFTLSRYLNGW